MLKISLDSSYDLMLMVGLSLFRSVFCSGDLARGRVLQYDVTVIFGLKIQPLKYITNSHAARLGHAQYLLLRNNEVP